MTLLAMVKEFLAVWAEQMQILSASLKVLIKQAFTAVRRDVQILSVSLEVLVKEALPPINLCLLFSQFSILVIFILPPLGPPDFLRFLFDDSPSHGEGVPGCVG